MPIVMPDAVPARALVPETDVALVGVLLPVEYVK
jgi:hypothetical protein